MKKNRKLALKKITIATINNSQRLIGGTGDPFPSAICDSLMECTIGCPPSVTCQTNVNTCQTHACQTNACTNATCNCVTTTAGTTIPESEVCTALCNG